MIEIKENEYQEPIQNIHLIIDLFLMIREIRKFIMIENNF